MKTTEKIYFLFYLFGVITVVYGSPRLLETLNHVKSKTSDTEQQKSVEDLLHRLIPSHAKYFVIHVNQSYFNLKHNMDAYEFYSITDGKIKVCGTTGVSAAAGVYHYLKYWCGIHISWSGDQLQFPHTLPKVQQHMEFFNDRFRYYQNVVTASYSMAFWDWKRWEREIDWMAFNGINFPLAFTGQETIWQIVYKQLGLTQEELDAHFAGPAFLAWQRMGNLDGWGGPLSSSWYHQQLKLQQQILLRMRSLGMIPILPGFAGHIPKALVLRLYPEVKYFKLQSWNRFPGTYLLDSSEPLFRTISALFITTQQQQYNGTDHVYNVDVFNELVPPHLTIGYISNVSKSIFSALRSSDLKAVWVLQAWFFKKTKYWTPDLIKAWVDAVPLGRLILLDLASDIYPVYKDTHAYYGHPFIWCMIENFGGTTRLYGKIIDVIKGVTEARTKYQPFMIGTGLTPEGINQNYINFEIMIELAWRKHPVSIDKWIQSYLLRRYHTLNESVIEAWKMLIHSVYNCHYDHVEGIFRRRIPVMRPYVTSKLEVHMWYNPEVMFSSWQMMVNCIESDVITDTLRHDMVMLGTQVLEDISIKIYKQIIYAYQNKSESGILHHGSLLVTLFDDMDMLLSSNKHSLLGNWLESAKQLGTNISEKRQLEYNARNQITLWGPNGEIHDYANKNWGGLVKSYYSKRWSLFIRQLHDSVVTRTCFNQRKFVKKLLLFEKTWNNGCDKFPTIAKGNSVTISKMLVHKYGQFYIDHVNDHSRISREFYL